MRRRLAVLLSSVWTSLLAVIMLVTGLATTAVASPPDEHQVSAATVRGGVYLVVLRDQPLSTYAGGKGDAAYGAYLRTRQVTVLRALGRPPVLYSFTAALSGFAAELSSAQVKWLQASPLVLAVTADATAHLDRARDAPDRPAYTSRGLMRRAFSRNSHAGDHLVIGVLDSGIWPENPSFAAAPLDEAARRLRFPRFTGRCQPGEGWTTDTCNAKVIAARYFVAGFGADNLAAAEFTSPRDGSGHGSHTASIAAGNSGVDVTIDEQSFGHVSGVAPGAAIAVYKACWAAPDPADDGCTAADVVKAVDQAVRDGVDVLNYSISATGHEVDDIVELAFLNAASAGVFIATSAGDDGPRRGTVGHASPWVTTVAATSHDDFHGRVRLGDTEAVTGAMVSDQKVTSAPLVYARDAADRGVSAKSAARCAADTLDADTVQDSIVLCDRGTVARVEKSDEVAHAGGVAMILANRTPGDTATDVHVVPTVHIDSGAGEAVRSYVRTARHPTASLTPNHSSRAGRTTVADFSARGPSADAADVLKPDVAAPGVGVVAAVAPPSDSHRLWDVYSGTSMSAPQVAGLAAVIGANHPRWSPAMVKSAIVTTASALDGANVFASGAGEIAARRALDPGLVYDSGRRDWVAYLAAVSAESHLTSRSRPGIDPSNLNTPTIAIGSLVGDQTVRRVVTNVSRRTEKYTAVVSAPRGVKTAVSPSHFTVEPGQSHAFTVTCSPGRSARYGVYAQGRLTWRGSHGHHVTSPIVARPDYVRAPGELRVSGRNGRAELHALAGVTGTIRTTVLGPVAADRVGVALQPGAFDSALPAESTSTSLQAIEVPADTQALRLDVSSDDDLDVYVYRGNQLVATATGPAGDEQLTLGRPAPGGYDVYVHAPLAPGQADSSTGELSSWVLPDSPNPALRVSPRRAHVTGGQPFSLTLSWRDLTERAAWLGAVYYKDADTLTYVTID